MGALSFDALATLRYSDVLFDRRDGIRLGIGTPLEVWVPSVPAPEFCAPCAYVRWVSSALTSPEALHSDLMTGVSEENRHVCAEASIEVVNHNAAVSVFTVGARKIRAMSFDEVRAAVHRRLVSSGVSLRQLDGCRDQLALEDVIFDLSTGG
ncbi:hypothetical protein GCM10025867_08520 [Frondihabitans sucicola]|uniref:Uncharacterized protein n=1 Tax=Frondihabitans sucicola TaxID=1268041 RepID=A0ABM8GJP4_9MICO|nr:hypothetical protein GCM10025867_08520 [Frondihabitans sucicola]